MLRLHCPLHTFYTSLIIITRPQHWLQSATEGATGGHRLNATSSYARREIPLQNTVLKRYGTKLECQL